MYKRMVLLGCFCLTVCFNSAQSQSLDAPVPYFMAVLVEDMDSSLLWYKDMLGFAIQEERNFPERGFRQANLSHGAAALELIEIRGALAPRELLEGHTPATRLTGLFKFGFAVREFDAWVKRLEEQKAHFRGSVVEDPKTGKKMVIVLDPDGNRIQLFEE